MLLLLVLVTSTLAGRVLIGLALVAVYFVITDTRNGGDADAPKGLN